MTSRRRAGFVGETNMAFRAKSTFWVAGITLMSLGAPALHAQDAPQSAPEAEKNPAAELQQPSNPGATEDKTPAAPTDEAASVHLSEVKATAQPAPATSALMQPKDWPLVAVLDLRHQGEDEALANALAAVITSEVANREGLRAVSRNELSAVLNHKAEQALMGCDSVKCAADIANLVEADRVISGGIERAGEALVLTLTLIDPTVPEVKNRTEAVWRSSPEEMVLVIKPYIERLLGGEAAKAYTGSLEVLAPDGSTVHVNSKTQGNAPLKSAVTDLGIGVHTVEVSQDGYYSALRDVVVSRGETTIVRVELEAQPIWTQWWFWSAVGGAAVTATAAGTVLGLWYLDENSDSTAGLGTK